MNKVGQIREELNEYLKGACLEQARAANGFLPNVLLEFLGCTAEYLDRYDELQSQSAPAFKESHYIAWQIPETGDPQMDTKMALCRILANNKLEFSVQVLLRSGDFQVRVNGTDICIKTIEQVRDFC